MALGHIGMQQTVVLFSKVRMADVSVLLMEES
jgi:hypothetical protein